MAQPLPNVLPISDLRTDLNTVVAKAEETGEPLFMTKNGRVKLVVMDSAAYEEEQSKARYILKLREAEIEAHYAKDSFNAQQVDEDMQRIFAHWGV